MESIQLILNDRLVSISAKPSLIQQLKTDDSYLSEYITNAVKSNQFTFLNEADLNKLTVKRAIFTKAEPSDLPPLTTITNKTTTTNPTITTTTTTTTNLETPPLSTTDLIPVWCRKGKPSDDDLNATSLLLQLRANEKYITRFNDKKSVRLKLWEEIANEIRDAGYDVDASKCQQKFLNMTKTHVKFLKRQLANSATTPSTTPNYNGNYHELKPPEFFLQMNEILQDKLNNSLLLADNDDHSIVTNTTPTTTATTPNTMKIDSAGDNDDDDDDDEGGGGGGDNNNNDESYHMRKKRKLCDLSDRFLTDRQFERLYRLYEERTKLMRERNQQNQKLLNLFERLINKFD